MTGMPAGRALKENAEPPVGQNEDGAIWLAIGTLKIVSAPSQKAHRRSASSSCATDRKPYLRRPRFRDDWAARNLRRLDEIPDNYFLFGDVARTCFQKVRRQSEGTNGHDSYLREAVRVRDQHAAAQAGIASTMVLRAKWYDSSLRHGSRLIFGKAFFPNSDP